MHLLFVFSPFAFRLAAVVYMLYVSYYTSINGEEKSNNIRHRNYSEMPFAGPTACGIGAIFFISWFSVRSDVMWPRWPSRRKGRLYHKYSASCIPQSLSMPFCSPAFAAMHIIRGRAALIFSDEIPPINGSLSLFWGCVRGGVLFGRHVSSRIANHHQRQFYC